MTRTEISRRQFIRNSMLGSAALLGLPNLAFTKDNTPVKRSPNFVIIFCDDMGYADVGCFGAKNISTPNVDRMAAEGVKLTSFYAQPVCTPSRAALLTGCYPMRVSLPNVINPRSKVGIGSSEVTIAGMLKTKGYATACIGKWHLGWQKPFLPTRHGFDYYFGIPYSNDMGANKKNNYPELPLMRNEEIIEQPADQDTLTQRYTQEAIKFITENKDRPFFLYLPHTMVHIPLHVSDKFRGKSKGGLYGDAVEEIDWSTGEIINTLKKLGLDDNTLVIFTSDNGPWLSKGDQAGSALPLRNGKATTYEGGVRVPFTARWPEKIPAGIVCSEMVSEMDILPTIAKLSGASVPTDRIIDGKDVWPLMSSHGAKTPHDALFFYYGDQLQAVRSGKWKLVLPNPDNNTPKALYDLDADISETTDVSEKHPKLVSKLEQLADQCREDLGDSLTKRKGKNCRACGVE